MLSQREGWLRQALRRSNVIMIILFMLVSCGAPPAQEIATDPPPAPQEEATDAPTAEPEAPETPQATRVETLRIGIFDDEASLTPYTYITGFPGYYFLMLQYDALYEIDEDGVAQPWLVSEADISEDGLTYTLDLRDDVSWHDGAPFTAEDVQFTFEYYFEYPHVRWAQNLDGVTSTVAESPQRVVITLEEPNPSFILGGLADVPIIPRHIWEDVTDPANHQFEGGINVGTGPYRLTGHETEQFYRFEAYDDYFAGEPQVTELLLIQFADETGGLAALRANEVDMLARSVSPEQVDFLQSVDDLSILQGPLFVTHLLNFNDQLPPFDQIPVRQAFALAIDREELVNDIFLGTATAGNNGWIHPSSAVYEDAVETIYDPAQAREILDEIGIVDGDGDGIREFDGGPMSFEIIVESSNPLRVRMAELISEMLLEVGIEATPLALERGTAVEAIWPGFDVSQGRNYELSMFGWAATVQVDPYRAPQLFHSDPAIGTFNVTGFASEAADELMAQMDSAGDPEEREALIKQLQVLIAEELPFVTLVYPDGIYPYRPAAYDNWSFVAGQGIVNKFSFLQEGARP